MNIVLNGSPACCCCGPTPIHQDHLQQRAGGAAVGLLSSVAGVAGPQETIHYNTFANGGVISLPVQLAGRVDPTVWAQFVGTISALEASQPNCCVMCFTCKCLSAASDFERGLVEIEKAFMAPLGATGFSKRLYVYQVWVPYQAGTAGTDGNPGRDPVPAHWENRQVRVRLLRG